MCHTVFCCHLSTFSCWHFGAWFLTSGLEWVMYINPKRFEDFFDMQHFGSVQNAQLLRVVFLWKTLSFDLQLMLSCSVVALLSSLLGLVGLAGLGHHYYHHRPHDIFQGEEVKDWSHDHHRHGHSMEAMKQILWWGLFFCFKI